MDRGKLILVGLIVLLALAAGYGFKRIEDQQKRQNAFSAVLAVQSRENREATHDAHTAVRLALGLQSDSDLLLCLVLNQKLPRSVHLNCPQIRQATLRRANGSRKSSTK